MASTENTSLKRASCRSLRQVFFLLIDVSFLWLITSSWLGRGGSSQRAKSTKMSAPQPVNLPSRRHERAGNDSQGPSSLSWGSPSTTSPAVLATSPSTASSPAAESNNNVPASGNPAGQGTTDSPQPDTSNGLPLQKPPRAWGAVAQTSEQSLDDFPTAAEASKKTQEQNGKLKLLCIVSLF